MYFFNCYEESILKLFFPSRLIFIQLLYFSQIPLLFVSTLFLNFRFKHLFILINFINHHYQNYYYFVMTLH